MKQTIARILVLTMGTCCATSDSLAGAGDARPIDMDCDGWVGGSDLGILLAAWGPCSVACIADLDRNGTVDGNDLGVLLAAWGPWKASDSLDPFSIRKLSTPSQTIRHAVLDADMDGDLDIVYANSVSDVTHVTCLLNDGEGDFATVISGPTSGVAPNSQAIAFDANSDGRQDLVLVSLGVAAAYHSLGDGRFSGPVPLAVPSVSQTPIGVMAADGGVRDDIVRATDTSLVLGVWQGGGWEFTSYPAAFRGARASTGDIDGDGDEDLVASSSESSGAGSYQVFRNDGGSLTPLPAATLPSRPRGSALLDDNLDGMADLVLSMEFPAAITVRHSQGDGTFGPPVTVVSGSFLGIATGDINEDGHTDLVAAAPVDLDGIDLALASVVRSQDGYRLSNRRSLLQNSSARITLADLDGRCGLELIGDSRYGVEILRQPDDGYLGPIAVETTFDILAHLDIDGDGSEDFIRKDESAPTVVQWGPLPPAGSPPLVTLLADSTSDSTFVAADVNGDQVPDMVGSGPSSAHCRVWLCASDRTYAAPQPVAPGGAIHLAAARINGDAAQDILAMTGTSVSVLTTSSEELLAISQTIPIASPAKLHVLDLDADGDDDAVCATTGGWFVVLVNHDGVLTVDTLHSFGLWWVWVDSTTFDFDGDNDLDIVEWYQPLGSPSSVAVRVWRNDGAAIGFTLMSDSPLNSMPTDYGAGDLDGDGRDELVSVNSRSLSAYKLSETGTPVPWMELPSALAPKVRVGHFDGDGRLDLLVLTDDGAQRLLLNAPAGR